MAQLLKEQNHMYLIMTVLHLFQSDIPEMRELNY